MTSFLSLRSGHWTALLTLFVAFAAFALDFTTTSAQSITDGAVYTISNASSGNQVLVYERSHDGTLVPAGAFSTGGAGNDGNLGSQGAVAVSDNGRFLLTVNAGSNTVALLAIRPDGLELLDTANAGGTTPIGVSVHGDLVYALNSSGTVAGFHIVGGQLEPIPGSVQPIGSASPGEVAISPDARTLLVSTKGANTLVSFTLDKSGVPANRRTFASTGGTPFGFAFDRNGHAIVSQANGSTLASYDVAADGLVTALDGPEPTTQAAACWVALSKDQSIAYTANAGSGTISSFRVANDGTLTLLHAVAGTTGTGPLDLALSNDGHYLYSLNRAAGSISAFATNADGTLAFVGTITGVPGTAFGLAAK